ncbi:hypothetical protein QWZ08_08325 [Ferruginibacter paludis]|uniref:hypothetical protein n=1 Tax=Ferruginibacter paludis TaxID=1310417 RepID=UPI0025B54B35|nr:hypothetical protein [Ferruginibacter paludis]MDN3655628.1 hypothetical protein [Ferruginibacter paludis]
MESFEIVPIRINSLKKLRDFIIDNDLGEDDTIILNQDNFDSIVIDHRTTYGESINMPFIFLGILVKEDRIYDVQRRQVGIIKNTNLEDDD